MMTGSNHGTKHRALVYDMAGQALTTITGARTRLLGQMLAECEHNHVYVLPDDTARWVSDEAGCPRCRALGLDTRKDEIHEND